jgi:hypothetical protein
MPLAKRTLAYLEKIEEVGGKASKTDLFKVSANVTNRDRMTNHLCECNVLKEVLEEGREYYVMTDFGHSLYKVLKNNDYLGPLLEELGKSRIQPK